VQSKKKRRRNHKKKGRGYQGAETISDRRGETMRPAEASVLADDEERLMRFLGTAKSSREHQAHTIPYETGQQRTVSKRASKANNKERPTSSYNEYCKVPKWPERVLLLLLEKDKVDYLTGDLQEEYVDILSRHGVKYANVWYWEQVIKSILSLKLGSVLRQTAVALFGEWIRRKIF